MGQEYLSRGKEEFYKCMIKINQSCYGVMTSYAKNRFTSLPLDKYSWFFFTVEYSGKTKCNEGGVRDFVQTVLPYCMGSNMWNCVLYTFTCLSTLIHWYSYVKHSILFRYGPLSKARKENYQSHYETISLKIISNPEKSVSINVIQEVSQLKDVQSEVGTINTSFETLWSRMDQSKENLERKVMWTLILRLLC